MKMNLNFEAEPLQLEEGSHAGGRCSCQKCSVNMTHEHETSFESEGEGEAPEGFTGSKSGFEDMESDFEAVGLEDLESEFEIDPAAPCPELAEGDCSHEVYADAIQKTKPEDGLCVEKPVDDPSKERAIQLAEYDINAHMAGQKEKHRQGLIELVEFINARSSQINASPNGITITIRGYATNKSGNTAHNSELACKRARCVEKLFRDSATIAHLRDKIHYKTSNQGFLEREAVGNRRELGDYRAVYVHVHPYEKVVVPPDPKLLWSTKFRVRNCSFKTESSSSVALGAVLDLGASALPDSVREKLEKIPGGRILAEKVLNQLQSLLKQRSPLLGRALRVILGAIQKFPIEFIFDTGIFQIENLDKKDPSQPGDLVLRYSGWGLRAFIPEIPLPESMRSKMKGWLKGILKALGFGERGVEIIEKTPVLNPPGFDSSTPGGWTDFETTKPIRIHDFEGNAELFKYLFKGLGSLDLSIEAWKFKHLGGPDQVQIIYQGEVRGTQIPIKMGRSFGLEIIAPSKGDLKDCHCQCGPSGAADARALVGRRVLMARRPTAKPAWSARQPVAKAAWSTRKPAAKSAWSARRPAPFRAAAPRRPAATRSA